MPGVSAGWGVSACGAAGGVAGCCAQAVSKVVVSTAAITNTRINFDFFIKIMLTFLNFVFNEFS